MRAQLSRSRFVRTADSSTRSHPTISRPRISKRRAPLRERELFSVVRIDAQQQPALSARGDRHVAVDQKGETTEHLLLGEPQFILQKLTQTIGEILVVGHGRILARDYAWTPAKRLARRTPSIAKELSLVRNHRGRGVMPPHQRNQTNDDKDDDRTGQHDRREQDDSKGHEPDEHNEHAHGSTPLPRVFPKAIFPWTWSFP